MRRNAIRAGLEDVRWNMTIPYSPKSQPYVLLILGAEETLDYYPDVLLMLRTARLQLGKYGHRICNPDINHI
jgi:hypothetical protein